MSNGVVVVPCSVKPRTWKRPGSGAAVQELVDARGRSRGRRRRRRASSGEQRRRTRRRLNPCGWSSGGSSAIRSTTFTTRTRRYGTCSRSSQAAASVSMVGHVAGAGQHDVGFVRAGASSVPAQSQTDAPAAQCASASSRFEVLQVRLLVDDDEVDVVAAAQAVVGDRQQACWRPAAARPGRRRRDSGITVSIRPGPWWEKPLWSLRQQVEVSSTFSEATGARHGSSARAAAIWCAGRPSRR